MPPTRKKPTVINAPDLDSPPGTGDRPNVEDIVSLTPVDTDPPESELEYDPSVEVDDGFSALFDNIENCYVDVQRLEPVEHNGVKTSGHCGRLTTNDSLETIRQRFGGGKFRLNKRSATNGKILRTATVDVAGVPVVGITFPPDPPSTAPPIPGAPASSSPVKVNINGAEVELTGTFAQRMEQVQEMILWTKMVNAMFPTPADPNTELLKALLDKRGGDTLDQLAKMREALPELFERGGGDSSSWPGIVQEAIKQAGNVLTATAGSRGPVRAISRVAPPSRELPAPSATPPDQGKITETESAAPVAAERETELTPLPTDAQIGLAHLNEVVKSFRLIPPKPANRVVALLDQLFQLSADRRAKLLTLKQVGFDYCENQLEDVFADEPAQRQEFERYYNEIFDEYTRSDRQAVFLA